MTKTPNRSERTAHQFLVLLALCCTWLAFTTSNRATGADTSQPNVIVIFIDDMG